MSNPVLALTWQCWRMSRRWYLSVLALSLVIGWLALYLKPPAGLPMDPREYQQIMAQGAVTNIFVFDCFCTLLAISLGNKKGFPFSFEYRLPVNTMILVAVPMLFLAVLCASFYFIPLIIYRFALDIPFPLLPGTALLVSVVLLLVCSSWITTNNSARSIAVILAIVFAILLFIWFSPIHFVPLRSGVEFVFNPDVFALDGFEYLVLLFVSGTLLGVTASLVGKLRRGDPAWPGWGGRPAGHLSNGGGADTEGPGGASSIATRLARLADMFAFPCPTTRPWLAECWVELNRYMLPVLVIGVTTALFVPLLTLLGALTELKPVLARITAASPVFVYLAATGLSLINRRMEHGGYMNVFEGSRAMSTPKLATIQILVIAAVSAIAIALVTGSLNLSSPLAGEPEIKFPFSLAPIIEPTFLTALTGLIMAIFAYVSIIAMFSCLHSCSIFWGRKFMAAVILFVSSALILVLRIRTGKTDLQGIIDLVWGVSIVIGLITLAAVIRIFQLWVISVKTGIFLLLGWIVFFGCSYFNMEQRGYDYSLMPRELLAFNMSMLLLPLTFAALTLWCYDRLRHT